MCLSRLEQVVGDAGASTVWTEDLDGARHRVSLVAYDGPPPGPGTWVAVHSGYALEAVAAEDAAEAGALLRSAERRDGEHRSAEHRSAGRRDGSGEGWSR